MAHFAKLDENNIVVEVLVVDNKDILVDGIESEQKGIDFLHSIGLNGTWIQTSYNNNFRNKYASLGDIYDPIGDVFVSNLIDSQGYEDSWIKILNPVSPSIITDSPARSANRWLNLSIHKAFPIAFQKWGYLQQHNPNTFYEARGKFDIIVTTIRNPIDLIASGMIVFSLNSEKSINSYIEKSMSIFQEILLNKDYITIFKFEDVINNTQKVLNIIGAKISMQAQEVNFEEVKSELSTENYDIFYSIPNNNQKQLDDAKELILTPVYSEKLEEINIVYNELIQYAEEVF